MDLKVSYNHTSNQTEAYKAACEQITPDYIAKWNMKADISYNEPKSIVAEGKGFTLTLNFTDSAVEVACKLSLMLKPFKGKVLDTVENKLKKHV
ncbi:MAG: hypothetical protein CME63_11735 [Halobacteriovoraceae bacterium]|nr:hypothetical protein [Halobacteriovoraceae bacterium]MBC98414.1 hypothetical protein [Halobacteriovoraceae bacterium]|tara:strand:+ start:73927 stop:74208 length:282 start_codon:yes stop_codon:yes gene_type:complete